MNRTAPFVDLHCHLLPGLDDGARDDAEALAMAEMATADGVATIIATPHQLGTYAHNDAAAIRAGVARLQRLLDERGIPLHVLPGADVRIEVDLLPKLRSGDVLTLADRRRHVLLELPHEIYIPLSPLLEELDAAGLVGILSHPERNRGILGQPHVLQPLVRRGCLLQVTAGSISGVFGSRIRDFAQWLLEHRMVHVIATDAHGVESRSPLFQQAFDRVAKLCGIDVAQTLCCHNPAQVAAGLTIAQPPARSAGAMAGGWFGWTGKCAAK